MKRKTLRPGLRVKLANGLLRVLEWNDGWNVAYDALQRLTGDDGAKRQCPVRAKDSKCIGNQIASGSEPSRSDHDPLPKSGLNFGRPVSSNSSAT